MCTNRQTSVGVSPFTQKQVDVFVRTLPILLGNCECCSQSRDPSVLLLQPSDLGSSVSLIRACHDIGAAAHVGVMSLSCLYLCGVSLCTDIVLWL